MNYQNNLQVNKLLNTAGKTAPEITHELAQLGNGHMSDGLFALWKDGQQTGRHGGRVEGAVGTAILFSLGIGGYTLIKRKMTEARVKRTIQEAVAQQSSEVFSEDKAVDHVLNSDNNCSTGLEK